MEIKMEPKKENPLPILRQDVKFYRGPDEADGSPTFNLYDPVIAKYYKISWGEATILQQHRIGLTASQLAEAVNKVATFTVTPEEVTNFFVDISRNNLLASRKASEDVLKEAERRKQNVFTWFIYHYLYFRIPLVNPDKFLARTIDYVMPLVSTYALAIYFTIVFAGLIMLAGRFQEFIPTFTYFFNIEGAFVYAVAIIMVKFIHEFAHAYTAKYYKLYVPTMGVAMIVLWPVLYTDVTDGWKLRKRSQRLAISFAGIAAETIIAGMTTFVWAVSEPGLLQSSCFVIASVTWISTLVINLNPAMRFDGYYIMCDLTGMDNLQSRAFSYTRWQMRKWLLGLDAPCPEDPVFITPGRHYGMIIYSLYTWIYRIFLYTAIAIFIYYKFAKALGVILFLVEVIVFILAPVGSEAKQLKALYPYLNINPRLIMTCSIAALLFIWFAIPLPHTIKFTGLTVPDNEQTIYVPENGIVTKVLVKEGDHVKKGETLVQMNSPVLDLRIKDKKADLEILRSQLHVIALNDNDRAFYPEKQAELAQTDAKLQGFLKERQLLNIQANDDGTAYLWDENVRPGQSIAKDRIIGKIAALNKVKILFYVPEASLNDIEVGENVVFRLKSNFKEVKGRIENIHNVRTMVLEYPQLASVNKGDLPVSEEQSNKLVLVESYFPVDVVIEKKGENLRFGEIGDVIIEGPWKSKLMTLLQRSQAIFWRESGV